MKDKKYIILIFVLFFLFIASIFFSIINIGNDNIFSKISINNIDVSKKSKEDAISLVKQITEKKSNSEIKFKFLKDDEEYEKTLDVSLLGLTYNIDDAVSAAYSYGKTDNIFINNFFIAKTLFKRKNFNLNYTYNEEILESFISDISANLPGKMVQTSYYIDSKNLIVTKGSAGIIVDKDLFLNEFKKFINNFSSENFDINIPVKYVEPNAIDFDEIHSEIYKEAKDAYYEKDPFKVYAEVNGVDFDVEAAKKHLEENPDSSEITVNLKYTIPEITVSNLNIDIFPDLLGSFSTPYDVTNKDRSNNLNLAALKIDGTVLSPGEEFSYNKIVGERSIAAGYKEAKIYSNGKVIDGLGGGICQISSTLYNAVVFANLKVTQRFNHQFLTSYVSAGRDATVAYGSKDFKFVNNRNYPIKIKVDITSGIAKVDIYGIKEDNEYEITFDTEIVSNIHYDTKYEIDYSLPSGTERIKQRGVDGVIVNVYKVINKNGITISREFISKDKYNSLDKVVATRSKPN